MDKWWPETLEDNSGTEISGDNFAMVVFDTDGGVVEDGSKPQYMRVAYGGIVGRLRPLTRGTDGFLGWFDSKGKIWDVEERIVLLEDVDENGVIKITAMWHTDPALIYTVNFVTSPSTAVIPMQYIGSGGRVVQPAQPAALGDGRAFAGWYTEVECIHRWNFDIPVTRNETLYARWSLEYLIVKFEANGGVRPDGETLLTRETAVFLNPADFQDHESYELIQDPGPLVKTGYSFYGWYLNEDFSGERWNFTRMRVTDPGVLPHAPQAGDTITLYAKWVQVIYIVNFVITPSIAAVPARQLIPHGEKVVRPDDLPMLGDGRAFVGWYTENELWDFDNLVTRTMTLYARFMPQTRTVHFQVNGGLTSSGMEMRSNFTIPISSGIILNPGSLIRPGYSFGGWWTDPACIEYPWDFANDKVQAPDEIIGMDPMYLYAKWTPVIPNPVVTFNWQDEDSIPRTETSTVVYGQKVERYNVTVSAGSFFDGWYTENTYINRFDFNTPITSNRALYGKIELIIWTVEFDLRTPDGGTSLIEPDPQHLLHNGLVIEPFMPPLPENERSTRYSFVRWDYSINDTDDPATFRPYNFNTPRTSDITLYARWVAPDPDMIWVPRGSFIMGDSGVSGSPAAYHSYPTRKVTVDGFFISRYPVIQGFVDGIINKPLGYTQVPPGKPNPSQFTADMDRPVERVSWYDAIYYCITLTAMTPGLNQVYSISVNSTVPVTNSPASSINNATVNILPNNNNPGYWNNGYRLPTEAEWEYAAKRGNNAMGPYLPYSGNDNPVVVAWFNESVKLRPAGSQSTQPVGLRTAGGQTVGQANELGIYHMSGNVSEWVWDRFISYKDYIALNPANLNNNPTGPEFGTERVRRGGAWSNAAGNVRSVVRNSDTPDTATWVNGFRVVRGPSDIY